MKNLKISETFDSLPKGQSEKSKKVYSHLKLLKKKSILKLFFGAEKKAQKMKFFQRNSKCLIGLSGGQDSICLGIFLRSLEKKWSLKYEFVYCHHAMQQENFQTLMQITQYAAYTNTGCFVFVNPMNFNIH